MKIAVLAELPLHILPGIESSQAAGSHASWFPQIVDGFAQYPDFQFHWITLTKRVGKTKSLQHKNQTFHLLPRRSKLMGALSAYLADRRKFRKTIATIAPDIVHGWGTEDAYGLATGDAEVPAILSMQGILQYYVEHTNIGRFYRLQAFYEKLALKRARYITTESKWGMSVLRPLAPNAALSQVEYGVHPKFFDTPWTPDPALPRAIFIGTITDRKGIADAVEAFAHPSMQNFELHVFGAGPLQPKLEARSTPNIVWRGPVPKDQLIQEMQHAWCLVLPTRADTSPNVVKEARVIGMPVVTTPHGGQSDYVFDGKNGYLVEPGDVPALRSALESLLTDFSRCKTFGSFQHQEQKQWFRPENTAKRFIEIYRKINPATPLPPAGTAR